MRTFCTEGPVNPKENYCVPRTALIAQGMKKMEQWQYVTIFAPPQSGKTTYSQFLTEAIRREKPDWLPVWESFERYGDIRIPDFLTLLHDRMNQEIQMSSVCGRYRKQNPPAL